jgi:hypothetical protein
LIGRFKVDSLRGSTRLGAVGLDVAAERELEDLRAIGSVRRGLVEVVVLH